jgi:hypothetical protein
MSATPATPTTKANGAAPAVASNKISRSKRAGLELRTGGVRRQIEAHNFASISADSTIALTAINQTIFAKMLHGCSELNKLSKKPKNLTNRLLFLVSQSDPQYKRVLGNWAITNSGIIPDRVLSKAEKQAAKDAANPKAPKVKGAKAASAPKTSKAAAAAPKKAAPKAKTGKAVAPKVKAVRKAAPQVAKVKAAAGKAKAATAGGKGKAKAGKSGASAKKQTKSTKSA